jgi:hypothetical protein
MYLFINTNSFSKTIVFFFFFLLAASVVSSQHPYVPVFKQAQPVWSHLLYNPLFEDIDFGEINTSGLNGYNTIGNSFNNVVVFDSTIFVTCSTESPGFAVSGMYIFKIDPTSGDIMWSDTIYDPLAAKYGMFANPKRIAIRDDGYLELMGARKNEVPGISNYPMSYRLVYDYATGERKQMHYDTTNTAKYFGKSASSYGDYVPVIQDSLYLHTYAILRAVYNPNFTDQAYFVTALINGDQNDIKYTNEYLLDAGQPTDGHSWVEVFPLAVNDSTVFVYIRLYPTDVYKYESKVLLFIFNIKDPADVQLVKRLDMTDKMIPDVREFTHPTFVVGKDDVTITNVWPDWDLWPNLEQYTYLIKLDHEGNILQYINKIIPDESGLLYNELVPFFVSDTMTLLWGRKYESEEKKFWEDIVMIDKNDQIQTIASLHTKDDSWESSVSFTPWGTTYFDNKIICVGTYYRNNRTNNATSYIMAFDLDDLIKGTITITDDQPREISPSVIAYPNPTLDRITITGLTSSDTQYHIINNAGTGFDPVIVNENTIDLSSYPAGVYFIRVHAKDFVNTLKVVKQ